MCQWVLILSAERSSVANTRSRMVFLSVANTTLAYIILEQGGVWPAQRQVRFEGTEERGSRKKRLKISGLGQMIYTPFAVSSSELSVRLRINGSLLERVSDWSWSIICAFMEHLSSSFWSEISIWESASRHLLVDSTSQEVTKVLCWADMREGAQLKALLAPTSSGLSSRHRRQHSFLKFVKSASLASWRFSKKRGWRSVVLSPDFTTFLRTKDFS